MHKLVHCRQGEIAFCQLRSGLLPAAVALGAAPHPAALAALAAALAALAAAVAIAAALLRGHSEVLQRE